MPDSRIDVNCLIIKRILFLQKDIEHSTLKSFEGRYAFGKSPVDGNRWKVVSREGYVVRGLAYLCRSRRVEWVVDEGIQKQFLGLCGHRVGLPGHDRQ